MESAVFDNPKSTSSTSHPTFEQEQMGIQQTHQRQHQQQLLLLQRESSQQQPQTAGFAPRMQAEEQARIESAREVYRMGATGEAKKRAADSETQYRVQKGFVEVRHISTIEQQIKKLQVGM